MGQLRSSLAGLLLAEYGCVAHLAVVLAAGRARHLRRGAPARVRGLAERSTGPAVDGSSWTRTGYAITVLRGHAQRHSPLLPMVANPGKAAHPMSDGGCTVGCPVVG